VALASLDPLQRAVTPVGHLDGVVPGASRVHRRQHPVQAGGQCCDRQALLAGDLLSDLAAQALGRVRVAGVAASGPDVVRHRRHYRI
jgi:hypothetical protein